MSELKFVNKRFADTFTNIPINEYADTSQYKIVINYYGYDFYRSAR